MKMNEYEQKNITDWFNLFTRLKYDQRIMIFLGNEEAANIIPIGISIYEKFDEKDIAKAAFFGSLEEITYLQILDLMDYNISIILPIGEVIVIEAIKNIKPNLENDFMNDFMRYVKRNRLCPTVPKDYCDDENYV